MHIVILCGGSGTRLWPASRRERPKQFLKLFGADSLLVETARRALTAQPDGLWVLTNDRQLGLARDELGGADIAAEFLVEPEARNTGPAIGWAAAKLAAQGIKAPVAFLPSDHHIAEADRFARTLDQARRAAETGEALIVVGKQPAAPETGYGYIERGEPLGEGVFGVRRFVEKPDLNTATRYVASGLYWWNTGIVVATPQALLREMHACAPAMAAAVTDALHGPARYADAPSESIDFAVLEKCRNVRMLEAAFAWSDVGTWSSWADHAPQDAVGNAARPGARVTAIKAQGNAVWADKRVVLHGVDDLIIVDTEDCLLITRRDHAQTVGAIAKKLAA